MSAQALTADLGLSGFRLPLGQDEKPKGIVYANGFEFAPPPPQRDLLGNPLSVPRLPSHKRPAETWYSRFQRVLARYGLSTADADTLLRWKAHDAIDVILRSVTPMHQLEREGLKRRAARSDRDGPTLKLFHPYQLRTAFDLLVKLPDALTRERIFLELLLGLVLRSYGDAMSAIDGHGFAFESEAREYMREGYKSERLIRSTRSGEERRGLAQQAYTNYFHGRNYMLYALLRRERLAENTRLMSFYLRAALFMARIDWDGELYGKPKSRFLPSRRLILFLARHHPAVVDRFNGDRDYAEQLTSLLKTFPD